MNVMNQIINDYEDIIRKLQSDKAEQAETITNLEAEIAELKAENKNT